MKMEEGFFFIVDGYLFRMMCFYIRRELLMVGIHGLVVFMSSQVDRTATIKKCLYIDACLSLFYLMLWKLEIYYTPRKKKLNSVQIYSPIRFFFVFAFNFFFNHHISNSPSTTKQQKKNAFQAEKLH